MSVAHNDRKWWYDHNAIERDFKTGDKMLILALTKVNKLVVDWISPGIIERQLSKLIILSMYPEGGNSPKLM